MEEKPKLSESEQRSKNFLEKLDSYRVTPSYSFSHLKIADEDSEHELAGTDTKLSINPFSIDSDQGKMLDTHNEIIKLQDSLIQKKFKKMDIGFVQVKDNLEPEPTDTVHVMMTNGKFKVVNDTNDEKRLRKPLHFTIYSLDTADQGSFK